MKRFQGDPRLGKSSAVLGEVMSWQEKEELKFDLNIKSIKAQYLEETQIRKTILLNKSTEATEREIQDLFLTKIWKVNQGLSMENIQDVGNKFLWGRDSY